MPAKTHLGFKKGLFFWNFLAITLLQIIAMIEVWNLELSTIEHNNMITDYWVALYHFFSFPFNDLYIFLERSSAIPSAPILYFLSFILNGILYAIIIERFVALYLNIQSKFNSN